MYMWHHPPWLSLTPRTARGLACVKSFQIEETHLVVVWVLRDATQSGAALEGSAPLQTTTLLPRAGSNAWRRLQDALGGMLSGDDDVRRGVGRNMAGEDRGVNDVEVIRAVDAGIDINDRVATSAAVASTKLACTNPMVGASRGPVDGILVDVLTCGDAGGGMQPFEVRNVRERTLDILDAADDGLNVVLVLQVGNIRLGDLGVETAGQSHTAAGGGATAQVLADSEDVCRDQSLCSHINFIVRRTAIILVQTGLHTCSVLHLADDVIAAPDFLEEAAMCEQP